MAPLFDLKNFHVNVDILLSELTDIPALESYTTSVVENLDGVWPTFIYIFFL